MLIIALVSIGIVMMIMWIIVVAYTVSKGRIFNKLGHDVLSWHLPDDKPQKFDGCTIHSHCKFCGKEIMQDSQGNWF